MKDSYLLDVLRAFHPDELEKFPNYLSAQELINEKSYHAESLLYHTIAAYIKSSSGVELDKSKIFEQVFPGQKFVPGKLDKVMVELNKLLKEFALTDLYWSKSKEFKQQLDWIFWLRGRGHLERAESLLNKLQKKPIVENLESLEQLAQNLEVSKEDHEIKSLVNKAKGDLGIPDLIYQLDLFYHSYRNELKNRYLLQQKAANLPDTSQIEEGSINSLQSVILGIILKIQHILSNNDVNPIEIENLAHELAANEKKISYDTLKEFYAYLRSCCALMINKGHLGFYSVLHDINLQSLEKGYLLINENLSTHSYINLAQTAIRSGNIKWAKEFTEKFSKRLLSIDENNFYYNFNMANCFFSENNFSKTLEFLPDVPSNSHYHHIVRRLELKTYYELKSDLLLYKLDAFRKYVERTASKSLAPSIREMDVNFLNILLQMAQSPPKDKARSARLIKRIEEKKFIADRQWLLEKARELG